MGKSQLLQRIRLVVSGNLRYGDGDIHLSNPKNPPARCIFQFSGQDDNDVTFPVEYVLRLMSDWADVHCDPYIEIQNTGVSVLFKGFFFKPAMAAESPINSENTNVILGSTQSTGISLSTLDVAKRESGMDLRPLRVMMQLHCFVRMPRVQLSFRFMGPEDVSRSQRLFERISNFNLTRRHRNIKSTNVSTGINDGRIGSIDAPQPLQRSADPSRLLANAADIISNIISPVRPSSMKTSLVSSARPIVFGSISCFVFVIAITLGILLSGRNQ
ncbi:nuclear egress membrane protein [Felid alphaherpesvirus 1]|uniref:Nuclear egress membrane protein n=1 Tax=Feline herpesvirus 1 TaxID=10334 RepID=D1FXU8_FHV1|nr:nuclear egress membrane protein [Felid alphaherpesvirus 1]AMN88956.1 nuclear egress membrane protein [synthetic construct]ACT88324.1 nuclear egress membrane protein [Felid alphaherpesvirus 1]ALJ84110.1 nuclear egress membrane protein [Felid alphaherpesvirus 1]ALJ84186.1 nuclear egress membrane protein [Felid alphaherpesvirus 1]ALJ84262.1 nuclear egress membrane protein [Felid alphaherpesvirus 1]